MKNLTVSWVVTASLFTFAVNIPGAVIYVRQEATGDGSGVDWANGVTSLSAAIAVANPGDELWVAAGNYPAPTPTAVNPETPPFPGGPVGPLANTTASFVFPAGVKVLGGFAGSESTSAQRDIQANPTVLLASCLDGGRSVFVYKSEADLIDGFVISGGSLSAGGMFGNVTRDCIFRTCFANPRQGQPGSALTTTGRVERCVFENNISTSGTTVWAKDAELINCRIIRNRNLGDTLYSATGAGVLATDSKLEGCLIANNRIEAARVTSESTGAGFTAAASIIINCTVVQNQVDHVVADARRGGGAYVTQGTVIHNSIFWGNVATTGPQIFGSDNTASVSSSIVQGGYAGTGIIDLNPLFADAGGENFRPQAGSPAVDAGNLNAVTLLSTRDLDDKPRVMPADSVGTAVIDLGAHEFGDYAEVLDIVIGPSRKARLDIRSSLSTGLRIEASTDLGEWVDLGAPSPNGNQLIYRDQEAPGIANRFYRIVSP